MNHTDTPELPAAARSPESHLDVVLALVDGHRVTMLSWLRADGQLSSKPMTVLRHDAPATWWFFMRDPGIDADADFARVNLAFADDDDGRYVSISARGTVVRDPARIHELWTPAARPFFPDGPGSPSLALLRVDAVEAEYWKGPSNAMTRGLALAMSIVAGKPVGLGDHGEVSFAVDTGPAVEAPWPLPSAHDPVDGR